MTVVNEVIVENVVTVVNVAAAAPCGCRPPPNVDNDNDTRFGVCSKLQTFDFFTGSEASFALSIVAIGMSIPGIKCVKVDCFQK